MLAIPIISPMRPEERAIKAPLAAPRSTTSHGDVLVLADLDVLKLKLKIVVITVVILNSSVACLYHCIIKNWSQRWWRKAHITTVP